MKVKGKCKGRGISCAFIPSGYYYCHLSKVIQGAAALLQGTRSRKAIERAGMGKATGDKRKNNIKKRNHHKTLAASVAKPAIHPTAF